MHQPVPCSPRSPPFPPHPASSTHRYPILAVPLPSDPIPTPQRSEGHTEVTSTALFLLKVFIFLSFHPFFYLLSPLPLSLPCCVPRLCELEDSLIKSSSFFQILSPNHPSPSSPRLILLVDLRAAQRERALAFLIKSCLQGRDGRAGGGWARKGRGIGS